MKLTIDIGNTSAKFALFAEENALLHHGRLQQSWTDVFAHIEKEYSAPTAVLISNVAGPQPQLEDALQQRGWNSQWLTWQSPEAQRFVSDIPHGLGADRLAADIGARVIEPHRPLLVVDAGTCLTFDYLDAEGCYRGGSISPGIELRLKAMHDHTALLPLLGAKGEAPVVGTDIETAMRGGCVNGLRWEIEGYVRHLLTHGAEDLRVFYTGGNELGLAADVEKVVIHDPLLVMRGLLAAYSEQA